MITEDYVSYEIAKLLKEKGFDVPCRQAYFNGSLVDYTLYGFCDGELLDCPSQSLALKWLREVYKLHIYAKPYWPQGDMRNKMSWQGFIVDLNTINGDSQCYADSYEEAIESRIRFALEKLI